MVQWLSELKLFFLDSLFPYRCLICHIEGDAICRKCLEKLPTLEQQFCISCSKPNFSGLTHVSCTTNSTAEGALSIYSYKNVSDLIIQGKYNFISRVFEILGNKLAEYLLAMGISPTFENYVITELPLSGIRQRWRGFNQSYIVASALSSNLHLPYKHLLKRIRHTKTQKDLPKHERKENVMGSFKIAPGINVKDLNVILIDDVVTTGSTLSEAVKALKAGGANKVWCITIARD